jgi:hypothetical protein
MDNVGVSQPPMSAAQLVAVTPVMLLLVLFLEYSSRFSLLELVFTAVRESNLVLSLSLAVVLTRMHKLLYKPLNRT